MISKKFPWYSKKMNKDIERNNLSTYMTAKNEELKKWSILENAIFNLSEKNCSDEITRSLYDIQNVQDSSRYEEYDNRYIIARSQADAADNLVKVLDELATETENNTRVIRALKTAKLYAQITKKIREAAKFLGGY